MSQNRDLGPQPTNPGYETLSQLARNQPVALQKLRRVVRKTHLAHYPQEILDDKECDRFIASLLPETQERLIKKAVDQGL